MSHPSALYHRIIINRDIYDQYEHRNTRTFPRFVKGIEKFTNDFHKSISNDLEGNFVSSALSAHVVLSMCAYGAKEKTAEEMKRALCLPTSVCWESFRCLLKTIDDSSEIGVATKILIDKNIVVKDSFKQAVESFFYSEITEVDFVNDSRNIIKDVNKWCLEKTHHKIREIISPKEPLEPTAKLMLLNVIYFKAYWQNKFQPACTFMDEFHIDAKKTIQVHMMHQLEKMHFKELNAVDAECVGIPYKNSDFVFVIIKPNKIDGLKFIENNLEKINLNYREDFKIDSFKDYGKGHTHTNKNIFYVNLSLPKFKIETTIDLEKNLKKLGMSTMFTHRANFKDISTKPVLVPRLHVHDVIQKAFIVVNEEGTEAVAMTRLNQCGGGSIEIREFKVDRPFLYRIVHKSTNVTLFSGCVSRPKY